ncbi:MAG TPA: glycosyltransferase family 4 protein [Acidimicrobiales bacterium]|nr:glycosyltransferase family 4 protein [Acidimicrobiales bacterium]
MRIAIIAPPWVAIPPAGYGGTEAVLDTLARGLAAAGHEVLLFTTGDSTCPVPRAWEFDQALGVGVGGAAAELRHTIAAYETVAGYDIVHDHTLVGPVYAHVRPELAVVTTNHGPFESDLGRLYRMVSDRVPVIAISHDQASSAEGVQLAGVIHHGLDVDAFPFGEGRGGYALFLGRMSPDKGVHTAIRVARAAGMPLRIAAKMAEIAEQEYFAGVVEPLLGGDVEYIGEVGGQDKLDLLANASCLLNPLAWREPFGMVMAEAAACGTPVVATACGAAPEVVIAGITGFLGRSEQELVAAVGRLDEIDRKVCRRVAEARFSAKRMVAEHLAVYQAVAEGWRPAPEQSAPRGTTASPAAARADLGPPPVVSLVERADV